MRRNCCILATLGFQCDFISPRFGNNAAQWRNASAQIRRLAMRGKGEDMMTQLRMTIRLKALCTAGAAGLIALAAPCPAAAQEADYLAQLKACRSITDEAERLACYDAKVGAIVSASDAGDVKVVSREEVRKTRRQLFGITMPDIAILKGDGKDEEVASDLFETTIASGRQTGQSSWRFTTAEGAVWEVNNLPRKLAPINPGDKVVFKKATLGYYFIRINGQIGVKGRRVQ